jgi:Na+/H+ antiporter NhaD/arsenite permease-like protein
LEAVPAWFQEQAASQQIESVKQHFLVEHELIRLTGEIASVLLFLLGAMVIVELIDAHEGFAIITDRIRAKDKRTLLWTIGWMAFFLSSVLDNLTTTIVMISLARKLITDREDRLTIAGVIVIAANAGGAWSVIGDVTTTMLWIKHKIGTIEVMAHLFAASFVCLLVPLVGIGFTFRGPLQSVEPKDEQSRSVPKSHQWLFLCLGIGSLIFVPIFKFMTHLPPYQGILFSLAVIWIVSELINRDADEQIRTSTGVLAALRRIDMSAILFFLGILLAVGALASTGILGIAAHWLSDALPSLSSVAVVIGLLSAVVDNVPLVAAGIEMYGEPTNAPFWMQLAYCAGTGGSCLIIGSAAGVAAMGMEKIDFVWYLRKIGPWALLGYFAGVAVLLLQDLVFVQ